MLVHPLFSVPAFSHSTPAKSAPACPQFSCVYFPLIGYTPPVSIFNFRDGRTRSGQHIVIEEIINNGSRPIFNVTLEAKVYSQSNQLLGTYPGKSELGMTLPGQTNPFIISTDINDYGCCNLSKVEITGWDWESSQIFKSLTVISKTVEVGSIGLAVHAQVRNDEKMTLADIKGVIWASGYPASRSKLVTDALAPGETASFDGYIPMSVLTFDPSLVNVAAQGVALP
jgi:hypothetical protein